MISTKLLWYSKNRFLRGGYQNQFGAQGISLSFPFLSIEFFEADYVRNGERQRNLSHILRILTEPLKKCILKIPPKFGWLMTVKVFGLNFVTIILVRFLELGSSKHSI